MTRFAMSNPTIASYMIGSPNFGELAKNDLKSRFLESTGANKAEANLINASLGAFGKAKTGELQADAAKKQASYEADAQRTAGMWGAIGSIAGGIGGLGGIGGGGGTSGGMSFSDGMNSGLPSYGDYSGIPSGGWGIDFGS